MPLQRVRATALARLLNSVERPIYVLDGEGTIVFCNQSLLSTIGPTAIDLLGRRCEYHAIRELAGAEAANSEAETSRPLGAAATAAGLCPPPRAMAGQAATGSVSWVDEDGVLHQRWARFIPLCDGVSPSGEEMEDVIAVVGLVSAADLPQSDTSVATGCGERVVAEAVVLEPVELHRRVRKFQHDMAAAYRMDRLIGDSAAIRRVRRQVELAATSPASVLLVGPPGGGRQHVAKTVHYAGAADDSETGGSLIPLACSVLGADLIRSTVAALSGSSLGGSSLGAAPRPATLLLNEADELPVEVQAELAAIFSRANFMPRLMATARRPLDELVAEGKFREDLASLLGTIVIELPPLARRRGDLPLLAQMFVERENSRGAKQIGGLTTEALDLLDGYDWPGNVDELALVIAAAHQTAESATIAAADLPKIIHLTADAAAHARRPEETIVLDEFLAQIERELLERALRLSKGNKAKAARMLGLSRPRLYRRLLQLGLLKDTAEADPPEQIDFQEDIG